MIASLIETPLKVGLAAILILLVLTAGRWEFGGRDISRFMVCGDRITNPDETPIPLQVLTNSNGYDGQFFARLAFAPFTRKHSAYGIKLGSPSYRQQRIFYPVMAWILAAGNVEFIPWTLVLVNFLAMIGIAVVSAKIAKNFNLHPGYGLLPMLSCGLILSFGRDLAEPLTAFLVISALYFLLHKKIFWCALTASLSVLTRESSLITFAAVGLLMLGYSFSDKPRFRDKSFLWLLLPLCTYLLWQAYLRSVWGSPPVTSGPTLCPYPLRDFFLQLGLNPYRQKPLESLVFILYLSWYFWLAGAVLKSFREKSEPLQRETTHYLAILRTAWFFWAIFILFLPLCMWEDDWGFTRIMTEWSMLGWLCLFAKGKRPGRNLIIFTVILAAGSILRLWIRP